MTNLSDRARNIGKSGILDTDNLAKSLEAQKRPLVKLHIGSTWQKTDDLIIAKAYEAMRAGRTGYEAIGTCIPEFAEALIQYWKRRYGVSIEREWIIAGPSAGLLNQAIDAILQPGRTTSIITPAWDIYFLQVCETMAIPKLIPMEYSDEDWKVPEFSGKGIDLFIVNDPHNPTSTVLGEESRQAILSAASETDSPVISDLAYDQLYWNCDFKPLLQYGEIADRTITVGSFSKSHRMAGWRMGYLISSDEVLINVLKRKVAKDWCLTPPFTQCAAAYALSKEFEPYTDEWRETVRRVSRKTTEMLRSFGVECVEPKGAIYVFARVGGDSEKFTRQLIEESGIATVPGRVLGENASSWIRITPVAVPEEKLYPAIETIGRTYQKWVKSENLTAKAHAI